MFSPVCYQLVYFCDGMVICPTSACPLLQALLSLPVINERGHVALVDKAICNKILGGLEIEVKMRNVADRTRGTATECGRAGILIQLRTFDDLEGTCS